MALVRPKKIGEPEVLASKFGRSLRVQHYEHPAGKVEEYSHWHADAYPSITLPLTCSGLVIAQWEFRYAIDDHILEVSGGNRKPGQTLEEVARTELLEETGYEAGVLIKLNQKVFPDPASTTFPLAFFLALNCTPVNSQKLDYGEYITPELIPVRRWFEMIWEGEIKDLKTIAISMLAMPYLYGHGLSDWDLSQKHF